MARLQRFPLLTKEEIAASPSVQDGVPRAIEARRHKIAIKHTMQTAANFNMSIFACAIGVVLYRRFYTRRSLKHNSSFIIAAASLFLASKINDEPRSHQEISAELLKVWYGRPPARARLQSDPAWTARLFASVLDGERVLLHSVGFDFDVDLPHKRALQLLRLDRHEHLSRVPSFEQYVIGTCNDILRNDPELVLEYSASELALAIIYFQVKVYRNTSVNVAALRDEPEEGADGRPWFARYGLSPERCAAITSRFMERLYNSLGAAAAPAEPSDAAASGTTASTLKRPREDAEGESRGECRSRLEAPELGDKDRELDTTKQPPLEAQKEEAEAWQPPLPGEPPPPPPERESSPEEGELEEGEIEG